MEAPEANEKIPQSNDSRNHFFFALNSDTYTSGATIKGVAVLVIQSKSISIKKLGITWEGKEFTNWWQGMKHDVQCTQSKTIFSKTITLWCPDEEGEMDELKNGTYTYPFSYELPEGLPTSYLDTTEGMSKLTPWVIPVNGIVPKSLWGDKSFITYTASAFVEEKDDKTELRSATSFRVLERYQPDVKLDSVVKEAEKIFMMNKVPMKMKVTIPNGVITFTGQRLQLKIEIDNQSKKKVDAIRMDLHELLMLHANGETFERKVDVFMGAVPDSVVLPLSTYSKDVLLDIPADLEPSITKATLIERKFELVVEARVSMSPTNLAVSFPLCLYSSAAGNIPPTSNHPEPTSVAVSPVVPRQEEEKPKEETPTPKEPNSPATQGSWAEIKI